MPKYDFLILGGGIGGLSIAALLATRGKRVCLLEKSNAVGGWAKTERIGDYQFVTGAQYLNRLSNMNLSLLLLLVLVPR